MKGRCLSRKARVGRESQIQLPLKADMFAMKDDMSLRGGYVSWMEIFTVENFVL